MTIDEKDILPLKKEMEQMAQDIFKNDMLGGAWHVQEFLIKHNIENGSELEKIIIHKIRFDILMIHFENMIHVAKDKTSRALVTDKIFSVLQKLSKSDEPLYWDPKQDLAPPSVREADIFNRGIDHVLNPIMNLAANNPKHTLQENLRGLVFNLKTQKVKPGMFTMSEWKEAEKEHGRKREIGLQPKKRKK